MLLVELLSLQVVDGCALAGRWSSGGSTDGCRFVFDGVVFRHRGGQSAVKVAQAIEPVAVGCQSLNGDGEVSVTDAVSVVNIILNGGSEGGGKTPASVEAVDLGLPSGTL